MNEDINSWVIDGGWFYSRFTELSIPDSAVFWRGHLNQNVLNQDISMTKLWSSRGSIHILAEKNIFKTIQCPVGYNVPGKKERAPAFSFTWVQLVLTIGFSNREHVRSLGRKSDREDSVLLQSALMKTDPRRGCPPQLSDFHRSKFKICLVFFFTLFVFLTLYSYPLSSLTQCPGEQPPYRRDVWLHEQEQSILFLPLWNAADFTL